MSPLSQLFALANAFKQGDVTVGGTADDIVRREARRALEAITLGEINRTTFVDDGVTEALRRCRSRERDGELDGLTVGRLKTTLLGPHGAEWALANRESLASEAIAAVVKVMSDDELSVVAGRLFNPLGGDGVAIGGPGHFGSRIQPNSPGDAEQEILFSTLDGLAHGCGDVVIGLNPASDDGDTIVQLEQLLERIVSRLQLPTRFCVLSDIVKQHRARAHTRVDVGFQSLAGTSRALTGMVGLDVDGVLDLARDFDALYFETGQGSEVTNDAADGIDMVTLEARTYGVARCIRQQTRVPWMIVNDVAGFIGPEVFREPEQLVRACLEDAVMAKLHGLTMGLDVCATFHMGISPATLRTLALQIVERAAPAYLMAVAGNADPMLGYLTTSFREHHELRTRARRTMASPMQRRLTALGVGDGRTARDAEAMVAHLYAAYAQAGGDARTSAALGEDAHRQIRELRERGFDLALPAEDAGQRVERLYANARQALYSNVDHSVVRDVMPRAVHVQTLASSRDNYLAHPAAGEQLRPDDAGRLRERSVRGGGVQLVVSDGLNADALNEQLRPLLPVLRRKLAEAGHPCADADVLVKNGRVRAGYEIGGCVDALVVIHLIGERPGTGLNTLSAYVTYGRDDAGTSRWTRALDHSMTTAICGIHPHGKPPEAAAGEIAASVDRMVRERRSGVAGAAGRRSC